MLSHIAGTGKDPRGTTLAEVLVATAVLSVGLMGLATALPVAGHGVHEGRAVSAATFLAEQKLEEVRNAAWNGTTDVDCLGVSGIGAPGSTTCTRAHPPCRPATPCVTFADESAVPGHPGYRRTVRVHDCAAGEGCAGVITEQQRLVRVAVTYRPANGRDGTAATGSPSAVLDMIVAKRR